MLPPAEDIYVRLVGAEGAVAVLVVMLLLVVVPVVVVLENVLYPATLLARTATLYVVVAIKSGNV